MGGCNGYSFATHFFLPLISFCHSFLFATHFFLPLISFCHSFLAVIKIVDTLGISHQGGTVWTPAVNFTPASHLGATLLTLASTLTLPSLSALASALALAPTGLSACGTSTLGRTTCVRGHYILYGEDIHECQIRFMYRFVIRYFLCLGIFGSGVDIMRGSRATMRPGL
jgi:hypothetical protein